MQKAIIVVLIILNILIFPTIIKAQWLDQPGEKLDYAALVRPVDHIANIRERLQERINLFFKFFPESKYKYQKELTERRLGELVYVIEKRKGDFIEETSSRYSTYLGRLTELVVSSKQSDKKTELFKMFENHNKALNELIKNFEANSGFWLLIQHDINSIKLYKDQIKKL